MALVASQSGDLLLLKYLLSFQTNVNANQEMHLYNNNHTPTSNDVLTNFTESIASNYTGVMLVGAAWTCTTAGSAGATASYAQQAFNFSAADTIYGYFVTSPNKGTLLWAELFTGGPFTLPASGGSIQVTPKLSLT